MANQKIIPIFIAEIAKLFNITRMVGIYLLSSFYVFISSQSGSFEFYINNKLIGTEEYEIQDRMIESTIKLDNGYNFRQKTLFDIDGEIDTYVCEGIINNHKVKMDIKRMNAKFAYTAVSDIKGTEYFAVLTNAERHIILDNYVASHYLSLIPRLNPNQKNELKVFIPQDGKIKDVIVEKPQEENIKIFQKKIKAYHYNFKIKKNRTVDLWTDYNTGEFLKVEVKELKLRIQKPSKK